MRTEKEIKERLNRISTREGRVYEEELCAWHNEIERELRRLELRWVLTEQ